MKYRDNYGDYYKMKTVERGFGGFGGGYPTAYYGGYAPTYYPAYYW